MNLFEEQAILPHSVEDVFALTVNLENAPHWHIFFKNVQQLTPDPVDLGSRWKVSLAVGSFTLEIVEFQPPRRVAFKGSAITGIAPNFTIEFQPVQEGTRVLYLLHPTMPSLWKPLIKIVAPPYGRWDLARYFRKLDKALEQGTNS
ncbi:hypothetical protein MNBD_CHLOROFLEXI01-1686 [hydrothermal vent metagenome]|uniref:SRPBCC family protein n=1 Tax=hydrothermal vent metagenome TaxID=652676 RepID=A0A3B0VP60_9ZZZZ